MGSSLPPGFIRWFVIQNNEILLLAHNNTLPDNTDIASVETYFLRQFQLGRMNDTEYCCAEIDPLAPIPNSLYSLSLRKLLSLFDDDKYSICVKAYSVITWDRNHLYCGRCGAATKPQANGFERVCSSCTLSFFPRISPSIIVLIKKDDQLLMARGPNFPPGVYGLIAGFVEIGESLEETVHREVKEEVGIEIKNLSYFGSQAWPFPDSLMIAFIAEYASGEISTNKDEIEDAGWYRYDNLPGLPSMSISIASTLLKNFVASCKDENV